MTNETRTERTTETQTFTFWRGEGTTRSRSVHAVDTDSRFGSTMCGEGMEGSGGEAGFGEVTCAACQASARRRRGEWS